MRNNASIERQLKEQILVLRKDKLSYREIALKIGKNYQKDFLS